MIISRSSFDWNAPPYDIPDMFSKPGTPCNDYNGYCDVFQKCREVGAQNKKNLIALTPLNIIRALFVIQVDPSGPLATLRKLLLSDESLATFRRWISEHWYAVTLVVLIIITLLVRYKIKGKKVFYSIAENCKHFIIL